MSHHRIPVLCVIYGVILSGFIGLQGVFDSAVAEQGGGDRKPPIDGFEQIIPRGRISAIVDPPFVRAEQAKMPDKAWILGFQIDGQAYAYDLNLLNSHEIVNHKVDDKPIAAVW